MLIENQFSFAHHQLESAAMSHQILLDSAPAHEKHHTTASNAKSKKSAASKKKKKKVVTKKQIPIKSEPTKHYRLNLAEIPFVAGQVGFCLFFSFHLSIFYSVFI